MKIKILSPLFLFLLSLTAYCSEPIYMTAPTMGLKGKVKTVTSMHYYASENENGEWIKQDLLELRSNTHDKLYFDEEGRYLQQDFLTPEKEVRAVYLLNWDNAKNQIMDESFSVNDTPIYRGDYNYYSKDSIMVYVHSGNKMHDKRFDIKLKDGSAEFTNYTIYDPYDRETVIGRVFIEAKHIDGLVFEFKYREVPERISYHFLFTYLTFDTKGNWITALKEDKVSNEFTIIEREIEYHND